MSDFYLAAGRPAAWQDTGADYLQGAGLSILAVSGLGRGHTPNTTIKATSPRLGLSVWKVQPGMM